MRAWPLLALLLLSACDDPCRVEGELLPDVAWFLDGDGDGVGSGSSELACVAPTAQSSLLGGDCDDEDASIFPGAEELCDGTDADCDGASEEDGDGDGFRACEDCDDGATAIYPGAPELCDATDSDCDGQSANDVGAESALADEVAVPDNDQLEIPIPVPFGGTILDLDVGLTAPHTWMSDLDLTLRSPAGTRVELASDNGGDTDGYLGTLFDDDAETDVACDATCAPFTGPFRPEQPLSAFAGEDARGTWVLEVADDQEQDVGAIAQLTLLFTLDGSADADADGTPTCADCDESEPLVPSDEEVCDGRDNDCDSAVDEGFPLELYWPDEDGDGYGDRDAEPVEACAPPPGSVTNGEDCDDGDANASPGLGNCSFLVQGTATFEDIPPDSDGLPTSGSPAPIRGARVEVVRESDGAVLASGETDALGAFSLEVDDPAQITESLYVSVQARRVVDGLDVWVLNSSDVLFAVSTDSFVGPASGLSLAATADPSSGRRAAAFNILHVFGQVADWMRSHDASLVFPNLVLRYEVNKDVGSFYSSSRSTVPFGDTRVIELLGELDDDDDGYDDPVIAHEIGHYIHEVFGSTGSPGGSHTRTVPSDPGLALGEGLATYVGNSALGSVTYVDTRGPAGGFEFSVDDLPSSSARGIVGEGVVAGVLWDLADGPASDDDPLSLGSGPFFEALTADIVDGDFKSLHSFLDAMVAQGVTTDGALDAAFGESTFFEVARPADPSYPEAITASSATFTGTVDGTVGRQNQPSNRRHADAMRFYGISLPTGGDVSVSLSSDSSDNLRLRLESPQRSVQISEDTGSSGSASDTATLSAGQWLVYVWANDGDANAAFTLEISLP